MGVTIRPLAADDSQAVVAILAECAAFSADEIRVAIEMIEVGLEDGPDEGYALFVAEVDREVRGYTCVSSTPLTLSTWHLYWIAVHPQWQGQGVGRQLQVHVEDYIRSRQGQRIVVETSGRPDYARARRFYEASGYREAGRIAGYYKPNDDCVYYCKMLS